MDMLKDLLQVVRDLPQTALWVIAFIFAYKVICVGSVYGVIRHVVDRLHNWLTTPKHTLRTVEVEMRGKIDGMCITGEADYLISQIHRLRGKRTGINSNYIHHCSLDWLREAIDEKEQRDAEAAAAKKAAA